MLGPACDRTMTAAGRGNADGSHRATTVPRWTPERRFAYDGRSGDSPAQLIGAMPPAVAVAKLTWIRHGRFSAASRADRTMQAMDTLYTHWPDRSQNLPSTNSAAVAQPQRGSTALRTPAAADDRDGRGAAARGGHLTGADPGGSRPCRRAVQRCRLRPVPARCIASAHGRAGPLLHRPGLSDRRRGPAAVVSLGRIHATQPAGPHGRLRQRADARRRTRRRPPVAPAAAAPAAACRWATAPPG